MTYRGDLPQSRHAIVTAAADAGNSPRPAATSTVSSKTRTTRAVSSQQQPAPRPSSRPVSSRAATQGVATTAARFVLGSRPRYHSATTTTTTAAAAASVVARNTTILKASEKEKAPVAPAAAVSRSSSTGTGTTPPARNPAESTPFASPSRRALSFTPRSSTQASSGTRESTTVRPRTAQQQKQSVSASPSPRLRPRSTGQTQTRQRVSATLSPRNVSAVSQGSPSIASAVRQTARLLPGLTQTSPQAAVSSASSSTNTSASQQRARERRLSQPTASTSHALSCTPIAPVTARSNGPAECPVKTTGSARLASDRSPKSGPVGARHSLLSSVPLKDIPAAAPDAVDNTSSSSASPSTTSVAAAAAREGSVERPGGLKARGAAMSQYVNSLPSSAAARKTTYLRKPSGQETMGSPLSRTVQRKASAEGADSPDSSRSFLDVRDAAPNVRSTQGATANNFDSSLLDAISTSIIDYGLSEDRAGTAAGSAQHEARHSATHMYHPVASRSAAAGRPALHLSDIRSGASLLAHQRDASPELSSKFSEFSSAAGTPEANPGMAAFIGPKPSFVSSSLSRELSSSSSSLARLASNNSDSLSSSDLGTGTRPSASAYSQSTPRRPEDLSVSVVSAHSPLSASMSGTMLDTFTPAASPRSFDRAGQIGIGELATPRLNLPPADKLPWNAERNSAVAAAGGGGAYAPTGLSESFSAPLLAEDAHRPSQLPIFRPQQDHTPALASAGLAESSSSMGAEAFRHARSTSHSLGGLGLRKAPNANKSLGELASGGRGRNDELPTLQSANPSLLSSFSSLSSLPRGFESNPAEFLAEFESFTSRKRERDSLLWQQQLLQPTPIDKPDSPAFSIDAVSDDESADADRGGSASFASTARTAKVAAAAAAAAARNSNASTIGDSAWSADEMGPFGSEQIATAPRRASPASAARKESARRVLADLSGGGVSESDRGSFDLNAAITDLLHEHDRIHSVRRTTGHVDDEEDSSDAGSTMRLPIANMWTQAAFAASKNEAVKVASDTRKRESTSTVTSVHSSRRASAKAKAAAPPTPSNRKASLESKRSSAASLHAAGSSSSQRASRGPAATSEAGERTSMPPTTPGYRRRTSTSSIAQSLLRGSMPPEAADEYQTLLSGTGRKSRGSGEITEGSASDALRKLDGIRPTTPRSIKDGTSLAIIAPGRKACALR
ncbi:hypothetical protein K437DRAFT_68752 [Tilletiaria anomala UBC 951]|uniref:Uncharacterized protein n=1 Tax=Tilletiaria anomala (strain ATCC 24038 / CBS 436.72 / UBC 951) TaxID=1037660 RepID=A0A066WHT6_TILAU|nr:uncharacterized protein K437DRAFT_68752 [Tilletiaria anomala UBC 951]KDN53336.1 hypothetical protein K437DRAFT_68752 [Tilletiaria anomala UBC 951]